MGDKRIETEAYKVSSEIENKIYNKDSYFYKPWMFADYSLSANTLKTTYEELYIWGRTQAMFRPSFKIEGNKVYVPNIFTKVSGTHKSIRLYRKEIKLLRKQPNTLFFKSFPLYKKKPLIISKKAYYSILDASRYIDKKKLMNAYFWKYRRLRTSLQSDIADRIIDFCSLSRFKNYDLWTSENKTSLLDSVTEFLKIFDINMNLNDSMQLFEGAKLKVFNILNTLEEPFINLLSKFDYPFNVPKIIVYNNGSEKSKICFDDAVRLMFMSSLGIDVIVYNPAGFNDIEDFLREEYYDIHRLEEVKFNLSYSFWTLF